MKFIDAHDFSVGLDNTLDCTLNGGRMIAYNAVRQLTVMLGFAMVRNAIAAYLHRKRHPAERAAKSINNTLKAQLDLERHGGRTIAGVASRVLQRILALTAAIWHNDQQGQPTLRSLTAYDQ